MSLVSTGTLGAWDRRRFRANVLLDGAGEDAFVGSTIAVGDVRLDVVKRIGRCVMTTRPQPDHIDRDLDVLRSIHRTRDGCLAVGAARSRRPAVCGWATWSPSALAASVPRMPVPSRPNVLFI